jgi:hypothetical protein
VCARCESERGGGGGEGGSERRLTGVLYGPKPIPCTQHLYPVPCNLYPLPYILYLSDLDVSILMRLSGSH